MVDSAHRTPRLGSYIEKKISGNTTSIEKAIVIQDDLANRGIYKPLGSIVVENGDIARSDLDECLRTMWQDILRKVDLFASLPPETLTDLAAVAQNVILPPGETVYRSSDKDDNYYVVASGSVRVFREGIGYSDVTFATLGPGEGFGEIALLTDEPRSASVETMERTSLIRIPRHAFVRAVFADPVTAQTCAKILAERLARDNVHIVEASATGLAYRQFISEQLRRDEPMLIGNSSTVMKLLSEIEELAGNDRPVLVKGETGTEMTDVAGLIHMLQKDAKGLLMGMDAKTLDLAETPNVDSRDPLVIELTQSGALFGRGYNALPFAPDKRLGLLTMARDGMVVVENIECLAKRVQEKLADYVEKSWFRGVGEKEMVASNARIIATSSVDLAARVEEGAFDRRLYRLISTQLLTVPPLRKRKKDLSIIVDELIRRNNRKMAKNVLGIDDQAYQSIMGYDWPGNTEELSVVIRRAVNLARGDRLMIEDIFLSPPPVTGKFTINLLQYGPVMRFFKSRLYPRAGVLVTAPFIALLIGLGLFGPQDPGRNVALILTWGLWEPMLIMSAFFAARMWCSVCPVGALSALVRKTAGLRKKAPMFIRNYGFYFSATGVAVIIAAESASAMPHSPRATALLVLTITTLAALSGFLFQRSTWCRYLCPLGSIVGTLSGCSVLELRSNYGVCSNTCKNHDCYTGTKSEEGCPMFEGPFSLSSNRNCVLCGACIKTCPNQSPVLNLRLPSYELWTVRTPEKNVAVVAIALIGTQVFRGMEMTGLFPESVAGTWPGALSLVAASIVAVVLFAYFSGQAVFGRSTAGENDGAYRIVYAFLPLAFAFEAGYHLKRMLTLGGQLLTVLGRQAGMAQELPGIAASPFSITVLQSFLVVVGGVSSVVLIRLMVREKAKALGVALEERTRRSWPALVLAFLYLWMFIFGK